MPIATVELESLTSYSQNKFIEVEKKKKELPEAFEKRTWRERGHYDKDDNMYIPPMQFTNCIKESAKFSGIKIPGKTNNMYTKHFEAGVMVLDNLNVGVKKKDVPGNWVHVPSNGQRGGGKRVMKCFPTISNWKGEVIFNILDSTITEDIFLEVLRTAGNLIGIGGFRPRNLGYFGRFKVNKCKWVEN